MHHCSLKGRRVSLADAIAYFKDKNALLGDNIPFAVLKPMTSNASRRRKRSVVSSSSTRC